MRRLALLVVVVLVGCTAPAPPGPDPTGSSPSQAAGRLDGELRDAAWANDVDRARRLIAAGADVNAKDATEQSAYLITTSEGYLELLELTLEAGGDVGSLDSYNGTGLIRAADRGHAAVCGRLVRAGVDVDHINRLGLDRPARGDHPRRRVRPLRGHRPRAGGRGVPTSRCRRRTTGASAGPRRGAWARPDRPAAAGGAGRPDHRGPSGPGAARARPAQGDADGVAIAVRAGADPDVLAERPADAAVLRLLDHLGHS